MKRLFLLDGHALVYRAHYSFITRPLINSKGLNTSAISGFTRYLWDIITNQKPTHLAVSFDLSGPTFRHKEFPEYKANREAQPEDITVGLPYIFKIIEAFNIPIVTKEGYEADDVIGTLSKQAARQGFTVYMVTPDKDYGQLVEDNILMYKPSRQGNGIEILGPKEIAESWGIARTDQVIDLLGLMGDAVDNIPGVPGVGEKTAAKLLQEYDNIENIISHAKELKGKLSEKIQEFAEQARMSRRLATIDINVPVTFDEKSFRVEEFNRSKLVEIFRELEFRTLAEAIVVTGTKKNNELFSNEDTSEKETKVNSYQTDYKVSDRDITNTSHHYILVNTPQHLQELEEKLAKSQLISFDTETTGIDPTQAELVGMSFAFQKGEAYYVPIDANQEKAHQQLKPFKKYLEDHTKNFIGQNIKFDILMMMQYGINIPVVKFDTMIAHYLLEPDLRHKLDILSESYLNYRMVPIEDLIGKKSSGQGSMRDVELEKIKEYAAEDADIVLQLYPVLDKDIREFGVSTVMTDIELPLINVLASMENEGVRIDADFLNDYSKVLGHGIEKTEAKIYQIAGVRFNISSPKQVGEVLFDRLKIPYKWKKTATQQYSTDEEKLNELYDEHELIREILEYRKLSKLKSTYVDALPQMINPRTGRVHSSFNQARAATGRLASENPNLQNIPIKNEEGREIRKSFIPRDSNHVLISADYSQIELRLIADLSNESAMLDSFIKNEDIHRATAARIYNIPYSDVNGDQRRNAKTINFSILYGAGSTNISRQLGISRAEAKELIDQYFDTYKGLKKYMNKVVQEAGEKGYVTTMLGRKRILRDITSRNALARSNAERVAINTPIQGTAADLIKIAMINIHHVLIKRNFKSKMILQVHDELVFDVLESETNEVKKIIDYEMRNAIPGLKVPLEVGIGIGKNWLEAH
ncbi:MAG: DNA polymerase I [Saprospiraceae bacterium]|nr:DNA polymerase I [Saprospiraceae bacterium]HMW38262.1 DNA polymerase I [Saprospiraceae bacterium]HMX88553.1 DNA polymerase I [Saprospiraceae bacterium]HMZ40550.1 DNA polymerase I [Saprospiraceae bacterium]HNA64107.1 DNA polymerase I [Saprospiraceae bacterium]